jgi:hypothetical protein
LRVQISGLQKIYHTIAFVSIAPFYGLVAMFAEFANACGYVPETGSR